MIQRAANSLRDAGLIEMSGNPDHKRAPLLLATEKGIALKRKADTLAVEIAEALMPALDRNGVREATQSLRDLRKQLEARLRAN